MNKQRYKWQCIEHQLLLLLKPKNALLYVRLFAGDTRISALFSYPNNWRLVVTDVTYQDSGLYVCQISTHPPKELHTRVVVKGKYSSILGNASKESVSPAQLHLHQ